MIDGVGEDRDLSVLVVPRVGAVEAGSDPWEPVGMIDGDGEPVVATPARYQSRSVATAKLCRSPWIVGALAPAGAVIPAGVSSCANVVCTQ